MPSSSYLGGASNETTSQTYKQLTKGAAVLSIVTKKYNYIVGVDTHAKKHVFAIISSLGELIHSGEFRVLEKDFHRFSLLIKRKTAGGNVLLAIEGTSSYGETLTKYLGDRGMDICEVKPPKTKARSGIGKTDHIDAEMAARGVLHLPIDKLIRPRIGSKRKILRTLLSSRHLLVKQQTMDKNALNALVRSSDIGTDARFALKAKTVRKIAVMRIHKATEAHIVVLRQEAKRLASSIEKRLKQLAENELSLKKCVNHLAPGLLQMVGVGPICAATILCAYSHKGRIHSEEAFASIAGVSPLPASSGNTIHYRLNKNGDRLLNSAFDAIAKCRIRYDNDTKVYLKKRQQDGKSYRDTKRILKRYIARKIFRYLETLNLGVD